MAHISPKFIVLFVLLCVSGIPLHGMDQPPAVQAQSGVSLQGKLKPVAEILERNIERYHEYEESHPVAAEFALKGSMVVAKGVLFAGAGTISGAAMGPVGAIGGAGVGFVAGISKGFADEIRGALLHPIIGHSLEPIITRGIDTLAPQFVRLDNTLDEREARVLSCCAIGSMLTAAEFKSIISQGMIQAATRGLTRSHAFTARRFTDDVSNPLYTRSRAHVTHGSTLHSCSPLNHGVPHSGDPLHAPLHLVVHGAPHALQEATVRQSILVVAEHPAGNHPVTGHQALIERNPAEELTAQELVNSAQEELSSLFVQTVQQGAQERLVTSNQLMQQEQSRDQDVAVQAIQEKITAALASEFNYTLSRNTLADSFDGFSSLLYIAGDRKAAQQIAALGYAGIKLMDSCHMLATGTALVGAAKGIALSPIAPFVGIATAVSTLLSVFGDDDEEDGNQQISQAINQMYHALSQQISQVHEHMMIRFDGLEHKVDDMHLHMVQGFLHLNQQMRDFHASQVYSFEKVNSDLQTLHTINAKVDALLLRPFILSCTDIERFASRSGSLSSMEEREAKAHCKSLENGLLGIDPTHDLLNGHVCADFTPIAMNRILKSISLQALLGYLAQYSAAVLCQPLPNTVRPKELPNTGLFAIGTERYLELRQATTHIPYDEQCQALQDISHVGEHALGYIDSVQNNRALFERLLVNYRVSYDRVQAICAQAFEKISQELLDRVHANALQVNRAELGTYPAYPVIPPATAYLSGKNSFLSGEHETHKRCLCAGVDWTAQNKDRFKVPILRYSRELLVNPDNTILNAFVMPRGDSSKLCQHFPLGFREKANMLERFIPMEAILAERLGLGIITMQYVKSDKPQHVESVFYEKVSLVIQFIKKSDGNVISLGVAELRHNCDLSSLAGTRLNAFRAVCFLGSANADYAFATNSIPLRNLWARATLSSSTPTAGSKELLSTLVDTELVSLRKAAIAQLLAPTEIGTAYARALEELDACYNALQAFGTVAGFSEQEKAAVSRLLNKNSFITYHQHYCAAHMSEADSPLLVLAPGTLEATSVTILARFAPQPAQVIGQPAPAAPLMQRENAFAAPLRILLARIGHFAAMYPEVARQTREEVARRAAEVAERARQTLPAQPATAIAATVTTERTIALQQRNDRLEGMVTDLSLQVSSLTALVQQREGTASGLSAQVAQLTVMMQQLLLQRVAQ